jgi:hypothetical protein
MLGQELVQFMEAGDFMVIALCYSVSFLLVGGICFCSATLALWV